MIHTETKNNSWNLSRRCGCGSVRKRRTHKWGVERLASSNPCIPHIRILIRNIKNSSIEVPSLEEDNWDNKSPP